jgi:hypothetical protein
MPGNYRKVHTDVGHWNLTANGIVYPMETPYSFTDGRSNMLVATGFGETNNSETAGELGERGYGAYVYNFSLPEEVELNDHVIRQTIYRGLSSVIYGMYAHANNIKVVDLNNPEYSPVNFILQSAGFAIGAKFATMRSRLVDRMVGVNPLLNTNLSVWDYILRLSEEERNAKARRPEVTEVEPLKPTTEQVAVINAKKARVRRDFFGGLSYFGKHDTVEMVNKLFADKVLLALLIGELDSVSRLDEARDLLGPKAIINSIHGGHEKLSSPEGIDQIVEGIKIIKKDQRSS